MKCEKSVRFESQLTKYECSHVIVELSPYLLRQLWNVHPSSGLSEAMTFEISWKVRNLFEFFLEDYIILKKIFN